jgi:subtilase family serine protease
VLAPAIAQPAAASPRSGSTASGIPGQFTVGDFANQYNVTPLYDAGLDGRGRTVGIVTLANFQPDDALAYWSMIGLQVDPARITQIHVDGGGELSTEADTFETSLDVEQAGGVAPGARVVVYDAPNNDQGFIDLFYQAASDNLVDSLSCSWGLAEPLFFAPLRGTDVTAEFTAFHQAFLEAAAQGISVFVASLDNGAYDVDGFGLLPFLSHTISVDHPADDPAVTATGGTTLPVTINFNFFPGEPDLVVPTEQVWGWDYLDNYFTMLFGTDPLFNFPFGTGGGVSVVFEVPWYQKHTPGIRTSEPGQSVVLLPQSDTPQDLLDLPANFAGRNVPDISANADPETGYLVVSSVDGGVIPFSGGTSFVAPQLNGVSALISQRIGTRLGLWNPMLYRYQRELLGTPGSPIVDITAGDNWFYAGVPGYEPGAGLGVLDVANLAAAIARDAR